MSAPALPNVCTAIHSNPRVRVPRASQQEESGISTRDCGSGANAGGRFAVPALVHLTQLPRFQRTKMLAYPYWAIGVNTIFSLCLLLLVSLFLMLEGKQTESRSSGSWPLFSVAGYTSGRISDGEGKEKNEKIKKKGRCASFPTRTGEDKTAIGLGVILWFFWLGTTVIMDYAAWYFRQPSVSPLEDPRPAGHDIEETTKDAFSSNHKCVLINKIKTG